MALDTRSFFIGIATVVGLLAVGFGSGIMMGGVISGDPKPPNKIERQAGKEPAGAIAKDVQPARDTQPQPKDPGALARDLDAIKPAALTPAAKPELAPPQTQPAPEPVSTQPAPQAAPPPAPPAPKAIADAPAQPAPAAPPQATQQAALPQIGAQKPVSLMQPGDQELSLSRREHSRLRRELRREERAQRRELRRQQMAERRAQEQQRREAERAAVQSRPSVDDDDDDDAPTVRPMPRPRGLFGLFPF
jgi:hypothetical protein